MTVVINGTTGYSGPVGVLGDLTTTGNTILGDQSTDTLNVANGNLVLDSTGDLGLGVTPSAWGSNWRAVEFANASSFAATVSGSNTVVLNNAFNDGSGFKYKSTAAAGYYAISTNQHVWYNAPSGTAGNAITFTQAMTLTSAGDWVLGATALPTVVGGGYRQGYIGGSNGGVLDLGTTSTAYGRLSADVAGLNVEALGAFPISFRTNSVVRATLNTSGNLGLAATPAAWALSGSNALQVRNAGFAGYLNNAYVTSNQHFTSSGGSNYISNGFANMYIQASGAHAWYNAGSGTAGNPITFAEVMTLDASANLSVLGKFTVGQAITTLANAGVNIYGGSDSGSYGAVRYFQGTTLLNQSTIHFFSTNWQGGTLESTSSGAINLTGGTGTTFGPWNAPEASISPTRMRLFGDRYTLYGPNSTWGAYLQVGNQGRISSSYASVFTTNGNLHMDPASGTAMYLNYYAGTEVGVYNGQSNAGYGTIKAAAFTVSSDYRLKENVVPIADGALSSVLALEPKEYDLMGYDSRRFYGFIAHELAEHLPVTVSGEKDALQEDGKPKYQGVDYMQLVPVLVKAIQELKSELDSVKTELAALKGN